MSSAPKSATHLTLGITHFGAVMDKLRWEVQQHQDFSGRYHAFAHSGTDPRAAIWMAINAAATGWSLIEWADHDLEKQGRRAALRAYSGVDPGSQISEVKRALRKKFAAVNLCHQLAHAVKHASLKSIDPGIFTTTTISVYASDGVPSLRMSGVVRRSVEGRFVGYNLIGNDLAEIMSWAVDFARSLDLPEHQ